MCWCDARAWIGNRKEPEGTGQTARLQPAVPGKTLFESNLLQVSRVMRMPAKDGKSMATRRFRHWAMLYRGEAGFLDGTLPFIREWIEAGEPTLVMVSAEKIDLLHDALGGDLEGGVHFADMDEVGANPGRIIPAWQRFVDEHGEVGRPLRGIGEPICATRTARELVECHRHEALLNLAFAEAGDFDLLCPYDTAALDPEVIHGAERTHPLVVEAGRERASDSYRGLEEIAAPFDAPLGEPPAGAAEWRFEAATLNELRTSIRGYGHDAGLDADTVDDLVTAVNELASNSVVHGGGHGTARLWRDNRVVVCEVRDNGQMSLPLAGRIRPPVHNVEGRGLWLANQVCDLIQIRSLPEGTVVRAQVSIA
jgi:anti-sigma regulatory factor (Ser/Thr protein kinase)